MMESQDLREARWKVFPRSSWVLRGIGEGQLCHRGLFLSWNDAAFRYD